MGKKVKRSRDLFRKMSMSESVKNNIIKADKSKQNQKSIEEFVGKIKK